MKCLVLDDDKNRLKMFEQWLWEPGVELVMVETAEECIQKLQCDHLHACDCELCPVNEACSSRGGALHKDGRAMLTVLREES